MAGKQPQQTYEKQNEQQQLQRPLFSAAAVAVVCCRVIIGYYWLLCLSMSFLSWPEPITKAVAATTAAVVFRSNCVGPLVARLGWPASCAHWWGPASGCWARGGCRARSPEGLPKAVRRRCMHPPLDGGLAGGCTQAGGHFPRVATASLRRNTAASAPNRPPTAMPTTTN